MELHSLEVFLPSPAQGSLKIFRSNFLLDPVLTKTMEHDSGALDEKKAKVTLLLGPLRMEHATTLKGLLADHMQKINDNQTTFEKSLRLFIEDCQQQEANKVAEDAEEAAKEAKENAAKEAAKEAAENVAKEAAKEAAENAAKEARRQNQGKYADN